MIIADTSVWVEFLRSRQPVYARLAELLERGMVLAHEGVFGELLGGARGRPDAELIGAYWNSLPRADEEGVWIEAGRLTAEHGLRGRGVGLVDAAILALAARTGAEVWTLDRRLKVAAGRSAFS